MFSAARQMKKDEKRCAGNKVSERSNVESGVVDAEVRARKKRYFESIK